MPKWIKKWQVPSSSGNGTYVVSLAKDGTAYGCSCPVWKFRRQECHHIKAVKNGQFKDGEIKKPEYRLAKVYTPTFDEKKNELLIPLVAFGEVNMEATICFLMLEYGYSMSEIKEIRRLPSGWTAKAIQNHIETYGKTVYPENHYENLTRIIL